jgi:hypothetical protein
VAGAREGSSWCCHLDLFCLAAKLSHVEGDVEGIVYHLHQAINCS